MWWMIASVAAAQTVGNLRVYTRENTEDELYIPNVSLQLSGETLIGGIQERQTDDNGEALFVELPPGFYTLTIPGTGTYGGLTIEQIQVSVDRTTVQVAELAIDDGIIV